MQQLAPFSIIPGEEIKSSQGEIIGLFLHQEIPPGLSAAETAARIRDQGGLVYIPHPFAWRASRLKRRALEAILPSIDAVEVFNARNLFRAPNHRAEAFARRHSLAMGAGSDAHTLREVGTAGLELPEFNGPQGFLRSLAQARIIKRYSPLWVHFYSVGNRLRQRLGAKA